MPSKKTRLALLYLAALVIIILILMFTTIMVFIIPAFKEMFAALGAKLPASTLVVIGISDFFVRYGWAFTPVMLMVVTCAVAGISMRYKRDAPMSNVIHWWVAGTLILSVIFFAALILFSVASMYAPVFRWKAV